jgi:hypothetical protein
MASAPPTDALCGRGLPLRRREGFNGGKIYPQGEQAFARDPQAPRGVGRAFGGCELRDLRLAIVAPSTEAAHKPLISSGPIRGLSSARGDAPAEHALLQRDEEIVRHDAKEADRDRPDEHVAHPEPCARIVDEVAEACVSRDKL